MSNQQFNNRVDQVAAGDIKNFIEVGKPEKPALLSPPQRSVLNALVDEISKECEQDPRSIWREVVHARVGVTSINEILRDSFPEAEDALIKYRDNHRRQANIRLMVARITNLTKAKEIYNERDAWCLRQFGEKHLNAMELDQLRQVLGFVDDFKRESVVQPQAEAVIANTEKETTVSGFRAELMSLARTYPWQCAAVAFAMVILGKIL
jgi:hypothetical protein